jgi:hypothetical protein
MWDQMKTGSILSFGRESQEFGRRRNLGFGRKSTSRV